MQQQEITPENLEVIKAGIKKISDFNVFSVRDISLHFQTLTSARASRMLYGGARPLLPGSFRSMCFPNPA